MNLQQLRAICEVVEHGLNISDAARALHTTQPAISKQIRGFETEMRTAVFVRSKGRLDSLTPAGRHILNAAKSALGSLAEIRSICASEDDSEPRHFVVAASRSMARDFLPGVVGQFMHRYPHLQVSIVHAGLDQLTELVQSGQVSLALTIESSGAAGDGDRILGLPFGHIPRVIVVPSGHPLLRETPLTLEAIAAFPLILYDETYSIRREVLQTFADRGIDVRIAINASGAEIIKAYVACDLGITVLAESAYHASADQGLQAIPAGHLFPTAITRILLNQHHFLKKFEYDFIQLCAPAWTRQKIWQLIDEKNHASQAEPNPD